MYIKVKVAENQEFKATILKRIHQELHQIINDDFAGTIKAKIEAEINKINADRITEHIEYWTQQYVKERAKSIVKDYQLYNGSNHIDEYIQQYIDDRLSKKFETLFQARFGDK